MTTSRLAILLAILLGGLSSVFLFPTRMGAMPAGIVLQDEKPTLPNAFGEWWGVPMKIEEKEQQVLGSDTTFARAQYSNGRGDAVIASIVLSGEDMMTSIHRPERCLRAQGWDFSPGHTARIEVPGKGALPVMRLKNRKEERLPDGSTQEVENICYYWFAGSREITQDHMKRAMIDMKDRVVGGYAQRWAMMMVASNVTGRQKFGRNEKETDEVLQEFIAKLAPQIHSETLAYQ